MTGDVTASLLIEKVTETGNGEVIVTYAAMDSSNNVAELSRIFEGGEINEVKLQDGSGTCTGQKQDCR